MSKQSSTEATPRRTQPRSSERPLSLKIANKKSNWISFKPKEGIFSKNKVMTWFKKDWGCAGDTVQSPCFCVSPCALASCLPFHAAFLASGPSVQAEGMVCHTDNRYSCLLSIQNSRGNEPTCLRCPTLAQSNNLEVDRTRQYGHWDPGQVMVVWAEPLKVTTPHPST